MSQSAVDGVDEHLHPVGILKEGAVVFHHGADAFGFGVLGNFPAAFSQTIHDVPQTMRPPDIALFPAPAGVMAHTGGA